MTNDSLRAALERLLAAYFDVERVTGKKNDYELDRAVWDAKAALAAPAGEGLREALAAIPIRTSFTDLGDFGGWNRYDTDDEMVLHLWAGGESWDFRVSRAAPAPPALDVERLARALEATNYGLPLRVRDGDSLQGRAKRIAAAYAAAPEGSE